MAKIIAPFTGEHSEQLPIIPGKSLAKYVIDLLKLAEGKGFPRYADFMDLIWQHGWRDDETMFCAVACAGIQTWLREQHKVEAWVEPNFDMPPQKYYKGYIRFFGLLRRASEMQVPVDNSYEYEFINAITNALNALPPAVQEK